MTEIEAAREAVLAILQTIVAIGFLAFCLLIFYLAACAWSALRGS